MLSQFSMFLFSVYWGTADSCCVSIFPFSLCYWLRHSHHCSSCSSYKKSLHRTPFTAKQNILPLCCHGCITPLNASAAPPSLCLAAGGFRLFLLNLQKCCLGVGWSNKMLSFTVSFPILQKYLSFFT